MAMRNLTDEAAPALLSLEFHESIAPKLHGTQLRTTIILWVIEYLDPSHGYEQDYSRIEVCMFGGTERG